MFVSKKVDEVLSSWSSSVHYHQTTGRDDGYHHARYGQQVQAGVRDLCLHCLQHKVLEDETPIIIFSYAWALYCMFVFYQATKKLIKKFRPILKFGSIKAIVFATYYQSLAVAGSSMSPQDTVMWNDFILCIEMVFFAGLLMIAFPTSGERFL